MSGDVPLESGVELPQGSAVETGQAQPLPEVSAPPSPSEQLAEAIAEAPDPITAIRTGADDDLAQLTLDTGLSPEAQKMADDASREFNENLERAADGKSPSTEVSDQDHDGAYTSHLKKANAEDRNTREFSPDDTPDVSVSDQDVADVAVEGAADQVSEQDGAEAEEDDRSKPTAVPTQEAPQDEFAQEREYLEGVLERNPRHEIAKMRLEELRQFSRLKASDATSFRGVPKDKAVDYLAQRMRERALNITGGRRVEDGSETAATLRTDDDGKDPALTAVLGKLNAAGEAATVEDTSSAETVETSTAEETTRIDPTTKVEPVAHVASGTPSTDVDSTGDPELDKLQAHLREITSGGEPKGMDGESDANYTREQIARREAELAADGAAGPTNSVDRLAAEGVFPRSDEDEELHPTVKVSGAAKVSILDRVKAGVRRAREGRRGRNATELPLTDSGKLPAWETDAAFGTENPVTGDVEPSSDRPTLTPDSLTAEAAPVDTPAPESSSSASPEAAPAAPPPTAPEAATTPGPLLSEARLAAIQNKEGKLTRDEVEEALRLMSERDQVIKLDRLGKEGRSKNQDKEFKALSKQFPDVLSEEKAAQQAAAITPLYSEKQLALNELRRLKEEDDFPTLRIDEFRALEADEARYKELSDKPSLNKAEQKELDEMGDTWKDPEVKAREKEIMDLAESSLDSNEDFSKFIAKLQEYSISKHGMFHSAFQEGITAAVEEFFKRPDSGMTIPEKMALNDVKRWSKEMQQEIVTLMTYKKQIEDQYKMQEELSKAIKLDEKVIEGTIEEDDKEKQKVATQLPAKYVQLASLNAAINVTFRRAKDVNANYAWRQRRVKSALGLSSLKDDVIGAFDDIARISRWAFNNFDSMRAPLSVKRSHGNLRV
ncbi:hypothetical protein KBC70_01585 [Candidatus Woesebacteria bacterium]|nr:hypothetical protein [Candidatus Woesebacteria bacterium]